MKHLYKPGDDVLVKDSTGTIVRAKIIGHWRDLAEYLLVVKRMYSFTFQQRNANDLKNPDWVSVKDIDNYIGQEVSFYYEADIIRLADPIVVIKKEVSSSEIDGAFCSQCNEFAPYQTKGFTCYQCREDRFRFKL